MKMGILLGILGLPYFIMVLFLFLKYRGVYLYLFPLDLIGVLREIKATIASFSMVFGDTLGDSSSSMLCISGLGSFFCTSSLLYFSSFVSSSSPSSSLGSSTSSSYSSSSCYSFLGSSPSSLSLEVGSLSYLMA